MTVHSEIFDNEARMLKYKLCLPYGIVGRPIIFSDITRLCSQRLGRVTFDTRKSVQHRFTTGTVIIRGYSSLLLYVPSIMCFCCIVSQMQGYTNCMSIKLRTLKVINRCGNSNNLLSFKHAVKSGISKSYKIGQIQLQNKRCLNNKTSSIVLLLTTRNFLNFCFYKSHYAKSS